MPHIRVVTDSACDIPENLLRQLDITVLPHHVRWGNHSFLDKININADETLNRVRAGDIPETDAPSVEEFSRIFRSMRDTCDGVIAILMTARLSETYTNASIAREGFSPMGQGGPFPVAVVDSLSVSMGLGWIVLAVARAAASGLDLPRLVGLTTRLAGLSHVAFFTEQTELLLKSGRVGRLAMQSEGLAQMRPLFHLDEGHIAVYEKTRTRAKARDALYNFVEDFPKIGELAVIHTSTQSEVEHLLTRIGAIYPRDRVVVTQPGSSLAAWMGPDALGVAVLEGEE